MNNSTGIVIKVKKILMSERPKKSTKTRWSLPAGTYQINAIAHSKHLIRTV